MKKRGKKKSSWETQLVPMLRDARKGSVEAAHLSTEKKKRILLEVAKYMRAQAPRILRENKKDLIQGKKNGLSSALLDRLTLTTQRVNQMADGVKTVAGLRDPIGRIESSWKRPNGLRISRVTVPLGVILIIYESRPNVTAECASLCIKSGNAVILRGGREAFYSNRVLAGIFQHVLTKHRVGRGIVNFMKVTDRDAVGFLLKRDQDINLVIPRGGPSLIRAVAQSSTIPVVKHYQGICHVYIDKKANLKKAVAIAFNAKVQRPSVCNAMETLLIHKKVASKVLSDLGEKLRKAGCEVRGDALTRKVLPWAKRVRADDYGKEFLDKVLAVRTVDRLEDAVKHIGMYGSGHTDAIVTDDKSAARFFMERVDSSSVMVNASTRFADGFEYGFGAEIGISTDKIHARGPMGLEGLTSYKYVVQGNGQIRG